MALSQERKGTMAVSLTNFLDSGCIVASSTALTAWAAAFGFGSTWTAILGAIGANAFGTAFLGCDRGIQHCNAEWHY